MHLLALHHPSQLSALPPAMLIGNKSDLAGRRAVSTSEGIAVARKMGAFFVETSAKENRSVVLRSGLDDDDDDGDDDDGDGTDGIGNGICGDGAGDVGAQTYGKSASNSKNVIAASKENKTKRCIADAFLFFLGQLEKLKAGQSGSSIVAPKRSDRDLDQLESALNIASF